MTNEQDINQQGTKPRALQSRSQCKDVKQ